MRKIPTLFKRDENDRKHVTPDVNPECQWVIDGEGVATRKFDGTCCLVKDRHFFKRYEMKKGKTAPSDFIPANDVDPETGKQAGWVPVSWHDPADKFHREAWDSWHLTEGSAPPDGTYELVGPKVQGNPEGYSAHVLINHATETAFDVKLVVIGGRRSGTSVVRSSSRYPLGRAGCIPSPHRKAHPLPWLETRPEIRLCVRSNRPLLIAVGYIELRFVTGGVCPTEIYLIWADSRNREIRRCRRG